jgi:hypothetical protein
MAGIWGVIKSLVNFLQNVKPTKNRTWEVTYNFGWPQSWILDSVLERRKVLFVRDTHVN